MKTEKAVIADYKCKREELEADYLKKLKALVAGTGVNQLSCGMKKKRR